MSVLIETTQGNIVVDLFIEEAPNESFNFLKLCKAKHFNFALFSKLEKDFIATCESDNNTSILGYKKDSVENHEQKSMKVSNKKTNIMNLGVLSFILDPKAHFNSNFIITLTDNQRLLESLNTKVVPFGEIKEGFSVLQALNTSILDDALRPLKDIRIMHTFILDDPFDDDDSIVFPPNSPRPTQKQLDSFRLLLEDQDLNELDETLDNDDERDEIKESKARSQALTLELLGDLPISTIQPSEKVLFICKLNRVTTEEDLSLIFNRFGTIKSCEILRDKTTGHSLCYGFIEFEDKKSVEVAYSKMDNVLIDDRRIHVDFSQSTKRVNQYLSEIRGDRKRTKYEPSSRRYQETDNQRDRYSDSSDRHKNHSHRSDRHRSDRHRSDRHRDDRHGSDRHSSDRHRRDRHRSDRTDSREKTDRDGKRRDENHRHTSHSSSRHHSSSVSR